MNSYYSRQEVFFAQIYLTLSLCIENQIVFLCVADMVLT